MSSLVYLCITALALLCNLAASDSAVLSLLQTNAIVSRRTDGHPKLSSLHDVVGDDGVLMIGMERTPERFELASSRFSEVGVHPVQFAATDGHVATAADLAAGCLLPALNGTEPRCEGKIGNGCTFPTLQAIADSHRRALLEASRRSAEGGSEWTAIMEDDVVPVDPKRWNAGFAAAFEALPSDITLVRLQFRLGKTGEIYRETGNGFRLLTGSDPGGGCTGGYLVHKDALPELLGLFPCCGPVDACFEELYRKKLSDGTTWAAKNMMLMDSTEVEGYAEMFTKIATDQQRGIMVQNKVELESARDADRRALLKK